ncbi:DUF2997 domain-containing protein [Lacipirellula sp.]|uniref:DUF2997 domain-containing protein n=1 Tax=Lacipirellula sp. TaxID=2691419 RepID=UPI003D126B8F
MKTIEITIGTKGDVQLETRGFAGASCRAVAKALVGSLGQAVSEQLTTEFHRSEQACDNELKASSTPFSGGTHNT